MKLNQYMKILILMQYKNRKEEIFKKRQEELKAKLRKKDAKRKFLAEYNYAYTPKIGEESPIKMLTDEKIEQDIANQEDEMPEWQY